MIYLLAIVILILLMLTYVGVNKDLMHPSVLVIGATLLCVLAAICNVERWNINYHFNTFFILVSGLICISLTGIFCTKLKISKCHVNQIPAVDNGLFHTGQTVYILVIFFNIVVLVWYYYIIVKTTGGGIFSEMLLSFRMIQSYGVDSGVSVNFPILLSQFIKVNRILAYIFMMFFLNNLIGYKKADWKYIIPPILFCVQSLIGSERIYIIILAGSSVVMAYIIWHRKNGWNINISSKYVKIAAKALVVVLIFFVGVKGIIRNDTSNPLQYLTKYIGGSIQLLDLYIQEPGVDYESAWGEETFSSIYKTVVQLQGKTPSVRHLEFRKSNGIVIGNIYTAIRKYYNDFGYWGVVILCSIFGMFFGIMYKKVQTERTSKIMSYRLCVYIYIVHCAFYFPLDDLFFSGVLSVNYLTMFIYMYILYYFLIEHPIKFKRKYTHSSLS